jgi:hypothetical protein
MRSRRGTMKWVCLLVVVTTACGGGSASPEAPAVSDEPQRPECVPSVRVQFFGDSTQVTAYGLGFLRAELHKRFGNAVVTELRAVSNSDSQQLRDGTDGLNAPWPGSVAAEIVVINHGINDAKRHTNYAANLQAFVGPGVVFETPNPVYGKNFDTAENAALMRKIGTGTIDVHGYVSTLPNWQAMVPDGVHPDAALHALIAQNVMAPALTSLIAARLCSA